jgi:hypothetical protein
MLSRAIERIILKCLAKDPEDRYPTGDALHAELVQLLGMTSSPDNDATVVMPTPVSGSQATIPTATPTRRRSRSSLRRSAVLAGIGGIAAAALVAATVRWRIDRPRPLGDPLGARGDTVADTVLSLPPLSPTPLPPERGTSPLIAPVMSAGVIEHELRVHAPAGATVWVDGARVGRGRWQSDTISPGRHRVAAAVSSTHDCPSARQDTTVHVREGATTEVALTPRPCGYLTLDALPVGAQWVVTSPSGGTVVEGTVPEAKPIVLPAGQYTLRVSARFCADYRGDFTVTASATHRERVRLICGG